MNENSETTAKMKTGAKTSQAVETSASAENSKRAENVGTSASVKASRAVETSALTETVASVEYDTANIEYLFTCQLFFDALFLGCFVAYVFWKEIIKRQLIMNSDYITEILTLAFNNAFPLGFGLVTIFMFLADGICKALDLFKSLSRA